MTERLYYTDSYLRTFEADIVARLAVASPPIAARSTRCACWT